MKKKLTDIPIDKSIVLFDGVCNLCNSSVNFIIDRDKNDRFRFAPLQSEPAKKIMQNFEERPEQIDSLILYQNGKLYKYSSAALHIAKSLSGFWPIFYVFIIIPSFLRNGIYKFIAKNRYKWFGKKDSCRMPSPELKAKFLKYEEPKA